MVLSCLCWHRVVVAWYCIIRWGAGGLFCDRPMTAWFCRHGFYWSCDLILPWYFQVQLGGGEFACVFSQNDRFFLFDWLGGFPAQVCWHLMNTLHRKTIVDVRCAYVCLFFWIFLWFVLIVFSLDFSAVQREECRKTRKATPRGVF